VYLAEDTRLERKVALKLLPAEFSADADRVWRFEREAKVVSALNHPNILTVYEFGEFEPAGEVEKLHFIATEYVAGCTLRRRLDEVRRSLESQSLEVILELAVQMAGALSAAHEAGVIHRDFKPENVMIRPDGLVKVLDFGLAKLISPQGIQADAPTRLSFATSPGTILGTTAYMSPEQACGQELDERTDVFSFGVVLYEMVAGCRPFAGESANEIVAEILKTEPPSLLQTAPGTPHELQRIIATALSKKREQRYRKMKDLLFDIKEFKRQRETSAKWPSGEAALAKSFSVAASSFAAGNGHRRKLVIALGTLGLILLCAAVVYFGLMRRTSRAAINAVAVLPFVNGNNDQSLDYLADGMSESLMDRLAGLPQLKVIARSSVFKFKGREIEPQQAAAALGVQALISGRVELRGDSLKVRAELVDARDGTLMWGQQFDRRAGDVQVIQELIAREVADRLRQQRSDLAALSQRAPVSPQAYEMLLRGRAALRKFNPEGMRQAREFYRQAIRLDPAYALAYAELAYAQRMVGGLSEQDQQNPQQALSQAEASIARALELDQRLAEAHTALAELKRDQWQWAQAEQSYRRALELNPNLAEAREGYALYLSVQGRHEQAVAEMLRARELDPLRLLTNVSLGSIYYNMRRYDEALAALGKALELEPDAPSAHFWTGIVLDAQGRYTDAIAAYQRAIKAGDDKTDTQGYLGYALARAGRLEQAQAILRRLQTGHAFVSPITLALLHTGLDEREQALKMLEQAYSARDAALQYLNVEPHFDSIAGDPRFQRLLRDIGVKP
ncbi:MAG TPA: protein kinase, partial [Blastocatellia bacterium]|nr:protein kinase [Blastocatellia bacterium]